MIVNELVVWRNIVRTDPLHHGSCSVGAIDACAIWVGTWWCWYAMVGICCEVPIIKISHLSTAVVSHYHTRHLTSQENFEYSLCEVLIVWGTHCVRYSLCQVLIVWGTHFVRYSLCVVLIMRYSLCEILIEWGCVWACNKALPPGRFELRNPGLEVNVLATWVYLFWPLVYSVMFFIYAQTLHELVVLKHVFFQLVTHSGG